MTINLASSMTRASSKQTYYTIRFLADRERVEDAYRAYAYFRWVDDILDSDFGSRSDHRAFLERQKALLESCYRGKPLGYVNPQEKMLVDLVQSDQEENSGLQTYLRNMMLVLDFDAQRRGRWISEAELNQYTAWLASSVTEAMHYFIGHGEDTPQDETRYLAVSAAHVVHLLRDTFEDVQAGYYNIPREVLKANHIGPQEIHSDAYRSWVKSRVKLAREYFKIGKGYLAQVQNPRCRLAGFAYMARFEWLLDTIEREGYCLRPQYDDRKRIGTELRMGWLALLALIQSRGAGSLSHPIVSQSMSK